MRLVYDCHTHTSYSHGKNTASEMVASAVEKGLSGIWITEHGARHMSAMKHRLDRDRYSRLRDEIEAEKARHPGMDIRYGTEANVLSLDGDTDISGYEDIFEFYNVGYHMMVFMNDLRSEASIQGRVILYKKLGMKGLHDGFSRDMTEVMLKVLDNYDINMITHPTRYYPMDMIRIAEKCSQRGTILEINSPKRLLCTEQIRDIIRVNDTVLFAVGSDAHRVEDVGNVSEAFDIIRESGLPLSRITNVKEN